MKTTDAAAFRRLHDGPALFLLANCWDAGSAKLLEKAGARAVATTSAGLAWSNGYPDGDALPVDRLTSSIRSIARVLEVPLTVDVEGGYSDDPAAVAETVLALAGAGAVGFNIEDGSAPPELLASKITAAKQRAAKSGIDVFLNARTDVYLRGLVPEADRVAETIRRARIYKDAGADGLFVPKVVAGAEIRELASSVQLPLNVLAWAGLPPGEELNRLGVRRLSSGSALAQLAYGKTRSAATAFLKDGRSEPLADGVITFGEMNPLFSRE